MNKAFYINTRVERPQQNSVVERKHQHILNVARALYFQSQVPIEFWTECVLTATFLINRTPSPLIENKSPYEILYQTPVDYTLFRVFGCLAFASTLASHRHKFQPWARTCVFLGYPNGMKAYKLYDIYNKQVFTSRDVVFHEQIFPFHKTHNHTTVIDPFPTVALPTPVADIPPLTISSPPSSQNSTPHVSPPNSPHATLPLRRSSRPIKPPSYLRDFRCHLINHHTPLNTNQLYPLSQVISYQRLSPSHRSLVLNVSPQYEPHFYHEAIKHPEWRTAMQTELHALDLNNTWTVVPLPKDKRTIGCRWIYKLKFKPDGSIDRHKARLVAKGYTQQEGIAFLETFSFVAKMVTVKVLLAIAASRNWHLQQLDVDNAFLNGDLDEEVYMDLPLGYQKQGELLNPAIKYACKLHKSLYGLKQSSRQWYSKLSYSLIQYGFRQS